MARRSRTEQAILGFLTWCPMSGYDIKKVIDASIGHFWNESYGQIYPILKRLADSGYVIAEGFKSSVGRPSDIYRLTDEGRLALTDLLEQPPDPEPPRNELLLKLFFGRSLPSEVCIRHIERHREQAVSRLETYAAIDRDIRRQHGQSPDLPYWLMTLSNGKHALRAQIAWCDETLDTLSSLNEIPNDAGTDIHHASNEHTNVNRGDPS